MIPTVTDAKSRLDILRREGPSADAFTFRSLFPSPDVTGTADEVPDDWFCTT